MRWTLQHSVNNVRHAAARMVEFRSKEERFRGLFEHVPVSIWEEDFSAVRKYMEDLRRLGVVDFSAYFDAHPEAVAKSAALVKVVDVNRATLEIYQADNKEQLLSNLLEILGPESLASFKDELLALLRGDLIFENEMSNYTLRGENRIVSFRLSVAPGYEKTWAKVFIAIRDITARRQAESRLQTSETMFRALFDLSPDAVLVIDPHDWDVSWPIIDCNIAAGLMNGYLREELIGQSIDILNVSPGTPAERVAYLEQLRDRGNIQLEAQHRRKNGDLFPVEISTTLIMVSDRELIIGIDRDITERKQIEESLRQNEERFKLMAWATKDAVWDWDLQTKQVWWGEGLQKIFHYSSEMNQTNVDWWFEHIHPEDRAKVDQTINRALDGGMEFWSKEYRFQQKDGTYAEIMDRGYILRDDQGKPSRMIGAMLDITERKHMESTLLEANEQMRQFLNELQRRNAEIALLNEMGRLLQACQSAEEAYPIITDLSSQLFPRTTGAICLLNTVRTCVDVAATWGEFTHANREFASDDCWVLRRGRSQPISEVPENFGCLHLTEPLPASSYCLPIQVQGEILGVFHVQSRQAEYLDETKRELAYAVVEQAGMALSNLKLREALREQSIRDPITGLYNRRYMEEALKQQVSRVTRRNHFLGIIMIDIDHFKRFNDTYGHSVGDALLRELGKFLQSNIRGEDVACRYGGEEFLLIMPDISLDVVQKRAEHLLQEVKQLKLSEIGQSSELITLSLGIAIYPQHGHTIEEVLRAADQALYRAKREGRDRVIIAE